MPWTVIINWSHLCLLQEQEYKLSFLAVCTAPALWHTWWCLTSTHLPIPSTLNWCKTLTLEPPIDDTLFCLGLEWEIWFKVFIYVAVTSTPRPWYGLISSGKCWVTSGTGTHYLFVAKRAPPALQFMWRYLALCAFRYSGYLEIQPHCTLARDRPNMLNFTETAYTPGVHGNMSNLDIQCACPSFRFELLIFCILPPALMLVVDLLPKLSFWTVHVWPCANAPSFRFELFIFCDVRIPWAFISFAMYTDRESVLARLTCHSILILSTAASVRWTF